MAIPSGLRALLSQMGLTQTGQGPATKAKASAMKGEKGPAQGQVLGEEGLLLAGLGYTGKDRRTDRKNVAERSNLTRYLREQLRDAPSLKNANLTAEEAMALQEGAEQAGSEFEASGQEGEARESHADQEVRQQERREEARFQGQKEAAEQADTRETAEASEAEPHHQQEDQDEEDKPGAGWVAEENEEEGDEKKRALRDADLLGQQSRCRGVLEDGTRCLRKPNEGTPYCAEHAAHWHPVSEAPAADRSLERPSSGDVRRVRRRRG